MGPSFPYLIFMSALSIVFSEWLKEYADGTERVAGKVLARSFAKWLDTFFLAAIVATIFHYMFG